MRTRRLGDSDLQVSALGLGCWPLGGGAGWGDIDEAQAIATIHAALDLGITFFDTAEGYNAGRSEEIVGRALCDRRDRAVIATKISPQNCAPAAIRAHCEASLRRLQTDYVDLYQVHWPIREHDVAAAFETLQALQREGKVRQLGISNFGVQDMSALLATGARPISNQLHYSLLSRAIETDIIPLCQAEGLGVICYMALLQGVLADAFASADEVPDFRARTRHFAPTRPSSQHGTPGAEAEVFAAVRRIRELATDLDLPMAVLSLAWVAAKPSVGCVLIGSRRPDQLARNLPAGDLPLSAEVVATLDAITEPVRQKLGPNPDYWLSGERARIR
jgi:aryl-alcohol dehydrogenase-like predicted oxidoreductase